MSVNPNNLSGTAALTFNDDFNNLSLWNGSSGTWSTTFWYQDPNGAGSTIATTHEQEWYINDNYGPTSGIRPWNTSNGNLILTAAPASAAVQSAIGGSYLYTSGEVNSFHSFSQTYGYFEIRAQLPKGQGFWPAFWLMPMNGSSLPELDVLEALSSDPTRLTTTSHSWFSGMLSSNATVADTTAGYHTYGMDWEPDFVTWYFDGRQVYQIATPPDMDKPMYMIANLAVGGTFAGNGDGVSTGQMQIDYIRAYSAYSAGGSATTTYDAATDTISTNGNYELPANVRNLTLTGAGQRVTGNSLGNLIASNNNNNTLTGGSGADTLIAGRGHDVLTGGGGTDTFVYTQFPWNTGQITDFTPGQDRVDIRGMLTSAGYTGSDPVGAGYLTLKTNGAGDTEVWFDPDGYGAGGSFWAFTLSNTQASALQIQNGYIVGAGSAPTPTPAPAPTPTPTPAPTPTPTPTPTPSPTTTATTSDSTYWAGGGVTTITLSGWNQTIHANDAGDTIVSTNAANQLFGGAGNDTFVLGRGGDVATGGAGADTFSFKEVPWTGGHITDFSGSDVLDLAPMLSRYGYSGSNPLADGRLKLVADGQGGTQVWVVLDGLSGASGTWLVTTLDHIPPASLAWQNGQLIDPPSGGSTGGGSTGAGQTYTSDNAGDHWTGTAGADTFNLGRGGDVVAGSGGADLFKFAEAPWTGGHITDFGSDDSLELTAMLSRYGYSGSNPLADGRITFTGDGQGGSQVWFHMNGLPSGSGDWLVTTLDGVAPSALHMAGGVISETASGSGSGSGSGATGGQTFTSDNGGDHWTGTAGADTFNLGRGGDIVAGGAGNDVFKFAEIPWATGHITDFAPGQDSLDLSAMYAHYGYAGTNPVGDGRLFLQSDGQGGTNILFRADGLTNTTGTWLVTDLDHVSPSSLHVNAGWITG